MDNVEKIGQLIKQITETGEWELERDKLKTIKSFCKQNDGHVQMTFDCIMVQLRKKHAQIRYASVQLIEQLFERSRYFRDALTEDFPVFTQLTLGVQGKKLPPPVQVAKKLKQYATALIKAWYVRYGQTYRQLSIAYDFLMDHGFLDQSVSLASIHANQQTSSNVQARRKAVHESRLNELKQEMKDHMELIEDNLTQMEGCFEILIPKNTAQQDNLDFDALLNGEADQPHRDYKDQIISHGLGSNRYKITIDLSASSLMEDIKETEENTIVFDQLRELYTLSLKHATQLNHWIHSLMKIEFFDKQKELRELTRLKEKVSDALKKCRLLDIQPIQPREKPNQLQNIEEEEDDEYADELFEEVDMKAASKNTDGKAISSSKLPPLQRIFPLSYDPNMMEDATYSTPISNTPSTLETKGKEKLDSEKEALFKQAPVVEWGDDLYYWDKDHVQFNTSGIERDHRFMGTGEGTHEIPKHLLEELRKRPIYYKSEAPKQLQACKHPLRNGGLCPRKDLVTCPFHGKIIPRDDTGLPLDEREREKAIQEQQDKEEEYGAPTKPPDPQVMKNLWELLEIDPPANKTKKKKKSALIDIRKKPDNPYTRLNRQINSTKTRKMAQEALEYEREMRLRNKKADM
ncbi:UV-stimulated scaffold protein A [Choanephora cucurbitarum]|uniref:UV-stimulated scaffold protein A n=1 Tax=Choanephora cucurbitarum TaxID=101091 RepID=A0A1C7N0S2_9FUNG|nr:UV-stimulated scaffold protein A [Choanephora cucurbitarum]